MTNSTEVSAAEAREGHSIVSALRSGVEVWFAVFGGIMAWAVHLVFFAAFVRYTCNVHGDLWVMHLVTAITGGATLLALFLSSRLPLRKGAALDGESGADEHDVFGFLGHLGLILNSVNLALILLEELMLNVLGPRRCG